MAGGVQFKDFSVQVQAELNETTKKWLLEVANEITAQAQRNCVMEDDAGKQLKGSYMPNTDNVDEGRVTVGTQLESGYWEEFGTGSYADTTKNGGKKGRPGWWVYVKGQQSTDRASAEYRDKDEAQAVADSMKEDGLDAYATNGRRPNYTLEKSFEAVKNPAIAQLKRMLKEMES